MNSIPYFDARTLRANYLGALDTALEELSLSITEAQWLRRLATELTTPDSMRIEAQINAQPLASSCLLIHQSDPSLEAVYLYSPLHGVQGFNTLKQLESALQAELVHLGVATEPLQFVDVAYPVFAQWSEHLAQQQIDHLERLSSSLGNLPTLRSTVATSLKTPFASLLDGVADPAEHRLQIVEKDTVLRTEALCDAALGILSGEPLGVGLQRRFLRGNATTVDEAYDSGCKQALLQSAQAVPGALAQALSNYWSGHDDDSSTDRRDALALALANTYALALLRAAANKTIDTAQAEWLREVLMPVDGMLNACTLSFKSTPSDSEELIPLAGYLVILAPEDASKGVFLFNPRSGLEWFDDQTSLKHHCRGLLTKGDRPGSITPDDWSELQQAPPQGISMAVIDGGIFPAVADSLMVLIKRRLAHALRYPGAQSSTACAAVEDALDIRNLIDVRLGKLGNSARWPRTAEEEVLPGLPVLPSKSLTLAERAAHGQSLPALLRSLKSTQPDVRTVAKDLLSPAISVLSDGMLRPEQIQVKTANRSTSLVEYFLERLCSNHAEDPSKRIEALDQSGLPLSGLDIDAIRKQVNSLTLTFSSYYLTRLNDFDRGQVRLGKGVFHLPSAMRTLYESLLRLELIQAREEKVIDGDLLDLLQQAMDRPEQTLLDAGFKIRGLSLKMPGKSGVLALTDVFVLQRAPAAQDSLLLWSPLEPLTQFKDEQTLISQMDGAFQDQEKMFQWLDLIHAEDLLKWHSPSVFPGVTVPSLVLSTSGTDLFGHLANAETAYRSNTRRFYLGYSIRSQFDALLLEHFVNTVALQYPIQKPIKRMERTLASKYLLSVLPAWLRKATAAQLDTYTSLLLESSKVSNKKFNYLFDIPPIEDFANARLSRALLSDYPQAPSDPKLITITFTHFIPNPVGPGEIPSPISADVITTSKSLAEFSLSHSDVLTTASSMHANVISPGQPSIALDAAKIRSLVDRTDIATAYRALIATKLAPTSPNYLERRRRYSLVATAYLMEEAYQHLLEGKLSAQGMYYVSMVLNQPDALARDSQEGKKISLCQLQLRASPDLPADTVTGMYLIGPLQTDSGPLVLYSAYRPEKVFVEYANEAAVRTAILADKQLQKDILERVPEAVRSRYDHKGFLHPHIFWSSDDLLDIPSPRAPVQLVRSEIDGNAIHRLFEDNTAFLNELAKARTVTTAEAKWQIFRYVMGLGLEQSSFFLPGRLASVVAALQSIQWFKASGDAALKNNWGEAIAEFVTALAGVATLHTSYSSVSRKTETPVTVEPKAHTELHPNWNELLSHPPSQDRLASLQATDIQLKDMVKNSELGLYLDSTNDRFFATVAGHVYEVQRFDGTWTIVKGPERGPKLKRTEGKWEADFKGGLRGGGAVVSALETAMADIDIETRFTPLAIGMAQIKAQHPVKHAMLVNAYARSRHYLETCLENLNSASPGAPLPPRSAATLNSILGHPASPETVSLLRDYTKRILNELVSGPMSLNTSPRIVVGLNMPHARDSYAFVYVGDPGKRIFLTERFFSLAWEVEAYAKPSRDELMAHQQAVTLIHELSHQTLKTVDIAYLEAATPFPDQFSLNTAGGRQVHLEVLNCRTNGLSINTHPHFLFKTYDNFAWRDIRRNDGRALPVIFRLTGKRDLDEARQAFYSDPQVRTDIILANADSLALLISRLGRRRFAPAG